MNIKYYIVKNQDINNDGRKEDLILKYRGDKFLGALPLKDYVDIDDYFSKIPNFFLECDKYVIYFIGSLLSNTALKLNFLYCL